MTKEEALALIEKKRDEARKDLSFTQKKAPSQLQATKAVLDVHSCTISKLYERIEVLSWAYDIVKRIEVSEPEKKLQQPSNDQNTVATGWQAAITGELKQKR